MPVSSRTDLRGLTMKPLLVGESNPYGGDPYYALYPHPEGCSGHRLCCLILKMRRADYLEAFDRANLCPSEWSSEVARKRAKELLSEGVGRPCIIILGQKVSRMFAGRGTVLQPPFQVSIKSGTRVLTLPHPSGLCRAWSDPEAFGRARRLVAENCPSVAHLIGID